MAVIKSSIEKESQDRYLTYALSVVSSRALPDVRDGLKPVQRRILYAMYKNLNLKPTTSYRKSASVVGEVLGNYHPHSDTACYEAMVRMAQDFSLRYPIVDGQGNFGSLDGDSPAAYRYTEARLKAFALEVIGEIDEETVEFKDNFDGRLKEPQVFPSRVPNLLVNGASGIAVGMATNIPPHNLKNVISALIGLLEDSEITNSKLVSLIKAPDFPTSCTILNSKNELDEIYSSGKGAIRMRGDWVAEQGGRGKNFIIITSIPYGVNKSQLIEKIASLITDKKLPQVVDIRDESTSDVRIVLELAQGADAEVAMAFIYKNTPLESNFNVNLTALVPSKGISLKPQVLSLKECLQYFLEFRVDVTKRKLTFEKKQLEARVHILEALAKIFDALDEAIKIVRKSLGRVDAAEKLRVRFSLTEVQSFAVVDMKIYQLSKTNIEEVREELKAKLKRIKEIDALLKSEKAIFNIIKEDLESVSKNSVMLERVSL
ncbi:MAG: DNA gyrase subunit A [Bdellovibrionota bacterium]